MNLKITQNLDEKGNQGSLKLHTSSLISRDVDTWKLCCISVEEFLLVFMGSTGSLNM